MLGLSPGDIDWLRKIIHVRRQVKIVGGRRVFAPPKGGKDRDVPLAGSIALRLSAHLATYPAAEVTLPWGQPGGKPVTAALMFTKDDEGAIWRNDFNRYMWHPALRASGVMPGRESGFHQLRHHFASTLFPGRGGRSHARRASRALRSRLHPQGVLPPDAGLAGQDAAGDRPGRSLIRRIARTLPRAVNQGLDLHRQHFTKL